MTASEQMLALVEGSKNLRRLCREYETESVTVHLKELVGGAFSLYAAATIRRTGGVHVFVAEDRDAAAYLLNDLYALLDERRILFFPSSYKRSIVYGAEDAQGVPCSARRRSMHCGRRRRDTWRSVPIRKRWPNGSSTRRHCGARR